MGYPTAETENDPKCETLRVIKRAMATESFRTRPNLEAKVYFLLGYLEASEGDTPAVKAIRKLLGEIN